MKWVRPGPALLLNDESTDPSERTARLCTSSKVATPTSCRRAITSSVDNLSGRSRQRPVNSATSEPRPVFGSRRFSHCIGCHEREESIPRSPRFQRRHETNSPAYAGTVSSITSRRVRQRSCGSAAGTARAATAQSSAFVAQSLVQRLQGGGPVVLVSLAGLFGAEARVGES